MSKNLSERERLLSVLWESAAVNEEWRRWIIADEILAAGFGDVARAWDEGNAAGWENAENYDHRSTTPPEKTNPYKTPLGGTK